MVEDVVALGVLYLFMHRGILKCLKRQFLCFQKENQSTFEILSHWHPNLTLNLLDDHSPWIRGSVPQPLDECKFLPRWPELCLSCAVESPSPPHPPQLSFDDVTLYSVTKQLFLSRFVASVVIDFFSLQSVIHEDSVDC